MDRSEALGRGLAQGASLGWTDEAMAKLLSALPKPAADAGIPRTYAAGSEENDLLNTERNANADAQAKFPVNYGAGQFAGGTPLAALAPVVGGGIAGAGLAGGALGALSGAGGATEGNRIRGAANGAGLSAIRAMGGAIAPRALEAIKGFKLPPPGGGLAPALAGEEASLGAAPAEMEQIGLNREQMKLPGAEPEYTHHNTPSENLPGIASEGLSPVQGGKNFPFAKNAGKVYGTDPESAPMWGEKLRDATGKEVTELRTTKPFEPVPGANESVKVRTETIPPQRLEMKTPGGWKPATAAAKGTQTELALEEPKKWYHATPRENLSSIEREGLKPYSKSAHHAAEQPTFLADEANSSEWANKLGKFKNAPEMVQLRTTKPSQMARNTPSQQGGGMGMRYDVTPPEALEIQAPDGSWTPLRQKANVSTPTQAENVSSPNQTDLFPEQTPLNFERGNVIRPNRWPSGIHDLSDLPTIPKPGNPGFRPSEVPAAMDLADAASLEQEAFKADPTRRYKGMIDDYAEGVKRGDTSIQRAIPAPENPVTVRPGKRR